MSFQYVYARKIRSAIATGDFKVVAANGYTNESGEQGIEYVCDYRGRRFYLSENRTENPSSLERLAKVLKDEGGFDLGKPLIWPNRDGRDCLYLEAWYLGRWYKFHTPIESTLPDEFSELIKKALDSLGC